MATSDITGKVKSANPVVPMIYAYTTPQIREHDGWTKIGYTEQDVDTRINQQTHTANVKWNKEWQGNAIYEDGSGKTFRDTDFHGYLKKLEYKNEPDTEWYLISGSKSRSRFFEFRVNRGVLDVPAAMEYALRGEQSAAVEAACDFARGHEQGEYLWNAKPRFGKTLSAYDLCKQLGANTVLIVTNRPAIANSWYDDYVKFLGEESGYSFVSNTASLAAKPFAKTREEYLTYIQAQKDKTKKKCIEFVSLQDLKGSIHFGGVFDKLGEVAAMKWDVLIIDEAHEGVDTYKTDVANDKFPTDAIFNWTYADEQQAKRDWVDEESSNPYSDLPQLNMFTYQMSDIVAGEVEKGVEINGETVEYAFDLNEFFATNANGFFVHNEDVDNFLNALTTQKKFPFSTMQLRDELKHTLWMLNYVASAKALATKLQKHSVFSEYKIVLAAGDGKIDSEDASEKAFDKVREAIAANDKTITISVGQLTTGVTVPEWTAVLMLSNMKSPSLYMQAAFRAQNPCLFDGDGGTRYRKENAYVFDFDPARTLTIFEEFANDLYASTASGKGDVDERKRRILTLLNFFPVIGEDENGEMIELDAEKVLSIPRKIRSTEVVRRGFMSDFLFQNISNIFRAPSEVIDIIQNFESVKAPTEDLGIHNGIADELDFNTDGDVEIPEEQVIGKAADMFGEKIYGDISDVLEAHIDAIVQERNKQDDGDKLLDQLQYAFVNTVAEPLVEAAKQNYGEELRPAQTKKLERKLKADAAMNINRQVGDYRIQKKVIEQSRATEMSQAETDAEAEAINTRYDEEKENAFNKLIEELKGSRETLVKSAGEDIVREVETAKKEKKKQDIEGGVRDHLRGFSCTIPSFLMAYGDDNTTLATFDSLIPKDVFKDVTSITVEQFKFLRDGGDFTNKETGEVEHFEGHLFDSVVFDDSVREFIRLRSALANYFDESLEEDIFDYVPPQKTNQIYTPKRVVKQMVDLFEKENSGCFD
ncbi:MAG: DEAD/DEAH box helicase family protein, partial [Gordonibacter sp.]|uniref:DEAD/DEAH box helicase family protein n=1 Tax=Gordonibacter sp. TaxID=1968902 RepID=UPI002FCA3523